MKRRAQRSALAKVSARQINHQPPRRARPTRQPAAAIVQLEAAPSTPRLEEVLRFDGRRLIVEGLDEIEICCGEASIVLRRNGRVLIRGAEVESRARGVNRIKGGAVKIN